MVALHQQIISRTDTNLTVFLQVIVVAFDKQIFQEFVKVLNAPHPRPLTSGERTILIPVVMHCKIDDISLIPVIIFYGL